MGFLIYFIGCVIATLIITFVLDEDWRTEGVTIGTLLINSIYGLLSWLFVIGFLAIWCVILVAYLGSCFHSDVFKKYLIKPKK